MKSMIFIAPPAAGKGTQAKLICEEYNLEHISTGDLLRIEALNNSDIKAKMDAGEFISDDIILSLIKNKIKSLGSKDGYILDGFPRNINQAEAFNEMLENVNEKINYVIYIDVLKETAKNRIVGRLYCTNCGSTYSELVDENKPKVENICDRCQSKLVKRADDNAETFENRFDKYMTLTLPLLDYYKNQNILYSVDGNQDSSIVNKEIKRIVEGE